MAEIQQKEKAIGMPQPYDLYDDLLNNLLRHRLKDKYEIDINQETTHQIEIISGRVIEYSDGDPPPNDFDPDKQIWIKVSEIKGAK